jgi:uncharacterized protein involved in exopolysaccharide biosynthesis
MVFLSFIMLSVAACVLMRTQYDGTALILVKIGRELVYHPDVGSTAAPLPTIDKDENIASAIEIMQSDSIGRAVIETIGLKRMYPDIIYDPATASVVDQIIHDGVQEVNELLGLKTEEPMTTALRFFQRKLKISLIKKTDIVQVSFLHPNPEIAARAANLVVEYFNKRSGEIYSDPNLAFQQKNVDEQRVALEQVETRLNEYRQQYKVYDLNAQMAALLAQRVTIDSSIKSDEAHISELQSIVATLRTQRAATPQRLTVYSDTQRNRTVDDAETQLLTLRIQEKYMASHFRDDYGPLITLRNQIALASAAASSGKAASAPQIRTGINDTWQLLDQNMMQREAELKSVYERQAAMRAQLGTIDASLKELSERERTLQDLQQDVALRTAGLRTTYDKLVEAQAVDGLNHGKPASFSLYQAAEPSDPANPARPLPLLYTLIAAGLGIVGSLTTVFLSYRMSTSFLTPEIAGLRLRLPVLAVVDYQGKLARLRPGRYNDDSRFAALGGNTHGVPATAG